LTNEIHLTLTEWGKKSSKKQRNKKNFFVLCLQNNIQKHGNGSVVIPAKCVKGSVGEGETGKLPGVVKNPPDFMKENNWNDTHTYTHPDIHTLTIVSRTHTFHCH
jgi:hypothetical protein